MARWAPVGLGAYMQTAATFFKDLEFPYINHLRTILPLRFFSIGEVNDSLSLCQAVVRSAGSIPQVSEFPLIKDKQGLS